MQATNTADNLADCPLCARLYVGQPQRESKVLCPGASPGAALELLSARYQKHRPSRRGLVFRAVGETLSFQPSLAHALSQDHGPSRYNLTVLTSRLSRAPRTIRQAPRAREQIARA